MRHSILLNFLFAFFLTLSGTVNCYKLEIIKDSKERVVPYKHEGPPQLVKKVEKKNISDLFCPLKKVYAKIDGPIVLKKISYVSTNDNLKKSHLFLNRQSRAPPLA